ncbi:MAG: hypothetical protein HZA27_01255 [Candidatus Omnitrophica bacterium]|nr:hypothetical protein [Candidatus Omnitrophota bacterium]
MQFYKRGGSRKTWQRGPVTSFLFLLRDAIIFLLPIKRLPRFIVKALLGINPEFIFFVHARRSEDIYVALPFLVPIRRFLGRTLFLKILHTFPPFVLDTIRTESGIDGLVITSIFLSETLLNDRRFALKEGVKGLFFGSKLAPKKAIFGLGGLWPMVTRRGLALEHYAKSRDIKVTNGHCGTLVSLVLTIKELAKLSDIAFEEMKIAILGAGRMGTNLARVLYGKVAAITLIDINETRLNKVEEKLREMLSGTDIQKYTNRNDTGEIKEIFATNHIGVCTTSNIRRVLKPEQIPGNTIIIDDSRPEGIPRQLSHDRIVLEGGLMKIKGIKQKYDFGFGIGENVFGCLAECFLLAADKDKILKPTLGEVDFDNFEKMISVYGQLGVSIGDFKCQDKIINKEKLISILKSKTDLVATIPFKNICWLLKIGDINQLTAA